MATQAQKVSQQQIAARLGLSQMTVSCALRGSNMVSAKTRRRVTKEAIRMGYRPNSSAQAMRLGRFGCVAIVESSTESRSSFFGGELFNGIHNTLLADDTHVTVAKLSDRDLTDESYVPKILRKFMADGVLINYFAEVPERLVELVERFEVPAVWINSKQQHDCVYPDDGDAARRATQYLIGLGHRQIGYLDYGTYRPGPGSVAKATHYSIIERFAGYADTMREAALDVRDFFGGRQYLRAQAIGAARQWVRQSDRPTAVLCYGGATAMQVILAAAEIGLSVPRDLSVMMFDDDVVTPVGIEVTTMRQGWYRIGQTASQMLMDKIRSGNRKMPCQTLPFDLAMGETCGPAPAA